MLFISTDHVPWLLVDSLAIMSLQKGNARSRRVAEIQALVGRGERVAAMAILEPLLRIDGRDPQLLSLAARIHHENGNELQAVALSTRAIAILQHPEPYFIRGDALRTLGRTEEAVADLLHAVKLEPNVESIRLALVAALEESNRLEEARLALAPILDRAKGGALSERAAYEHSKLLIHSGDFETAVQVIDRAVAHASAGSLPFIMLLHLRAKALDRSGRFDEAWESVNRAHDARGVVFDPEELKRRTDTLIGYWNRSKLLEAGRNINVDRTPVFIAGMPRSGTSLIDQVIHAHPLAAGVGELNSVETWAEAVDEAVLRGHPESASTEFAVVARRYLADVRKAAPRAERIVNKALGNTRILGHLGRLFPGSCIIHVQRDPRDVAVSCVMGAFGSQRYPWTARPEWVAAAWRDSQRLMEHWSRELDLPILDVRYESLVQRGEPELRRIIDFIGLPWDAAVKEFHRAGRTVRTLSYDQVSRPLYADSIGRWKNYERHLGGIDWPTTSGDTG
jgi:tetratricopeptide (TPR) repeat protein